MRVEPIGVHYRGFDIGRVRALRGWRPAWRTSTSVQWEEGFVYSRDALDAADTPDVVRLARECIDFRYLVEVFEFLEERRATFQDLAVIAGEKSPERAS